MTSDLDGAQDPANAERPDAAPFSPAAPTNAAQIPWVAQLSGDIGARPAGSDAERRAADLVASALEQAGLGTVQLPVAVQAPGPWIALLYAPLGLLALLVCIAQPWLGLALVLLVTLPCLLEINGRPLLTTLLPKRRGHNVLAIAPSARQEIRRLVVAANLDSVSPAALNVPILGPLSRTADALTLPLLALAVVCMLARAWFSDRSATAWVLLVPAALLMALLALAAARAWLGRGSPGAVTNASGLAALIDLAEHLTRQPPDWVEVWFLAASAGEARANGMRGFLASNHFDPDTTYFIHLQSVGGAQLRYARSEGQLFTRRADPALARLLAVAGAERPALAAASLPALRRDTQAGAIMRAGYEAVTLVGADERGAIPRDGAVDDAVEWVDSAGIRRAVGLLLATIGQLDSEAAERNRRARLARRSLRRPPPSE